MNAERTYNVLFLCTGNSARSILAESLLNHWGKGRFQAFSAGSFPKRQLHPLAIDLLKRTNLPSEGFRSKSWDEFAKCDAPKIDFIFTVCDDAAGEVCPIWPGHPAKAHWGVPDPSRVNGTDEAKRTAFLRAYTQLRTRIELFTNLPLETLDRSALQLQMQNIGTSLREKGE